MNEKRQELIRLCADKPKTARQLVQATGESTGTVRTRLYDLVKVGALTRTEMKDSYGTHLYHAVPGWRKKEVTPEISQYKPLGMCVWGVWM